MSSKHKSTFSALFLDRDGVLNARLPGAYVADPADLEVLEGVEEGLRLLQSLFRYTFIVTNQQGVGKGLMSEADLQRVHEHLLGHLAKAGIRIDAIYCCPDLRDKPGNCRKPAPELALRAKRDFPRVAFGESLMVGDSVSDILFGQNLGMKTARVLTRFDEEEAWQDLEQQPDFACRDLRELARLLGA